MCNKQFDNLKSGEIFKSDVFRQKYVRFRPQKSQFKPEIGMFRAE